MIVIFAMGNTVTRTFGYTCQDSKAQQGLHSKQASSLERTSRLEDGI